MKSITWKAVVLGVWKTTNDRHLGLIAAGVAFFTMFAIFPALAAVIAIWGFWADPAVILAELESVRKLLPPEAFDLLQQQILDLVYANDSKIGWTTVLPLMVALWSARAGVAAMVQGLNAIHGVPNRNGLGDLVLSLVLTVALVGVSLVALVAVIVLPLVVAFVPLGPFAAQVLPLAKWSVMPAVVVFGLGLIYRFGPNRDPDHALKITPGIVLSLVLWLAASEAFSLYLTNFGNYNRVYGSIGAVIALLTWFYLSAYAVLLGAALNSTLAGLRRP